MEDHHMTTTTTEPGASRTRKPQPWPREARSLKDKLYYASMAAERTAEGCLLLPGTCNDEGYGRIWEPEYGDWLVHRAVWFAYHGELHHTDVIHHVCGNRGCFELSHLVPASQAENVGEMLARRHYEGERARREEEPDELHATISQQ